MNTSSHFEGKDALHHVAEKQAKGLITSAEAHSPELPDHHSCFSYALKDTAFVLALVVVSFHHLHPPETFLWVLAISWALWKSSSATFQSYGHLERLKRLTLEEKYEIENHRQQEREELGVIYAAKGFEGPLLEQVLDVLMADDNRLLKVMLEEELGLVLDKQEHPLKQGIFALMGGLVASFLCLLAYHFFATQGLLVIASVALLTSTFFIARFMKNPLIPAVVWNLGIFWLCLAVGHCLNVYFSLSL